MKKLLIVTQKVDMNDSNLGFFHRWLLEFAKHYQSIVVICLEEGAHELPANVRVLSLGKEHGRQSKWQYARKFWKLISVEKGNYDQVFVHMNPEYVVLGCLHWRLWGKKIALWYTHKSVNWKLRFATLFANRIFTASKESFRISSDKVLVTGHGIDTEFFKPGNRIRSMFDGLKIVTNGRYDPSKKIEVLIEAVYSVKNSNPSIINNVLASGKAIGGDAYSYYKYIKQLIVDKGLTSEFVLGEPKTQEQIRDSLQQSDLFIHASSTGSLDKAPLEAMSTGVVVLSCNDSFKDILSPDKLTFKSNDEKDLASLIIQVSKNQQLRELGLKLREIVVKNHSLTALITKIVSHLDS